MLIGAISRVLVLCCILIVLSFLQRGLTLDDASAAYDALEEAGAKAEIQATS